MVWMMRLGKRRTMLWTHGAEGWELSATKFEDAEEKWAFWLRQAEAVGAQVDALVFISEVWLGSIEEGMSGVSPAESPNRREALQIYAETRDGRCVGLVAPFHHEGNEIAFEDMFRDDTKAWFTQSFRDIWSREKSSKTKHRAASKNRPSKKAIEKKNRKRNRRS